MIDVLSKFKSGADPTSIEPRHQERRLTVRQLNITATRSTADARATMWWIGYFVAPHGKRGAAWRPTFPGLLKYGNWISDWRLAGRPATAGLSDKRIALLAQLGYACLTTSRWYMPRLRCGDLAGDDVITLSSGRFKRDELTTRRFRNIAVASVTALNCEQAFHRV